MRSQIPPIARNLELLYTLTSNVGTEFQSWLLWYALPVLQGLLPPQYYQHYSCLVAAIGILLETPLTRAAIDSASSLLDNFCSKMEHLYGKNILFWCFIA